MMVLTHGKPILVIDGMMFMSRGHLGFLNLTSGEGDGAQWELDVGMLGPFFKKKNWGLGDGIYSAHVCC